MVAYSAAGRRRRAANRGLRVGGLAGSATGFSRALRIPADVPDDAGSAPPLRTPM